MEELADLVGDVTSVFLMFDNDDAGRAYIEDVNAVLPHKMVYVVPYEGNDPDDLLKRSEFTGSMEELLQSATLLPSIGYYFRHTGKKCALLNREFDISVGLTQRGKDGDFRGDVEFRTKSGSKEIRPNVVVSKFKHKDIPSDAGYSLYKELVAHYDIHLLDNDLQGLHRWVLPFLEEK